MSESDPNSPPDRGKPEPSQPPAPIQLRPDQLNYRRAKIDLDYGSPEISPASMISMFVAGIADGAVITGVAVRAVAAIGKHPSMSGNKTAALVALGVVSGVNIIVWLNLRRSPMRATFFLGVLLSMVLCFLLVATCFGIT